MRNNKFRNKYRIESARLAKWDYGGNAFYHVTICTKNRKHFFGEIVNGEMQYTQIGEKANTCWSDIPNHFPFVELDVHIIMPNHVHGILSINKIIVETQYLAPQNANEKPIANIETQYLASLPKSKNKFGPQSKNLGSIVRGFKIGVTNFVRDNNLEFAWQPRYHDRIIRDIAELERTRKYILDNPVNWFDNKL